MAVGKKITQLTAGTTAEDTGLIEVSQLSSGIWTSFRFSLLQIANYVISKNILNWVKTTYTASSNTFVNLGSSVTYGAVRVIYVATQGVNRVTGQLDVVHNGTTAKVSDGPKTTIGTKLDYEIKEADLNTEQIRMKISVGITGDVDFVYRIEQKPLEP